MPYPYILIYILIYDATPLALMVSRIHAHYDSKKEWRSDPKGYFIIKVFYEKGEIGLRYCNYHHEPLQDIYGTEAEAMVQTAVREGLLSSLQHAAYLGHELHKAEVALKKRLEFVQDKPLDFSREATGPESHNVPERQQ